MLYLPQFLTIAVVHLFGAMSPGPDFVMITRTSLRYSRRSGIYAAVGLALGILVHVTYAILGLSAIIAQSVVIYSLLKYAAALYLMYIGWQALRSQSHAPTVSTSHTQRDLSPWQAIRLGFWTNVLNPKAAIYFLSVFTLVISPTTPVVIRSLLGVEMAIVQVVWFSFVAALFSHRIIRDRIRGIQHWVDRAFGAVLIALGLKVALSHR